MSQQPQQGSVKISHRFFAKIKDDYADWRWALVREFMQNCFDAPGCRNVTVVVERRGQDTFLSVGNDGAPMNRDTLVNKLLTLGGSGKEFMGDNTGGFGVAKSLLYYTHLSYGIHTGNLLVQGTGADYAITETDGTTEGTVSGVTVQGDEVEELVEMFNRFCSFAQWNGQVTVNGEAVATGMKKGARRKDMGWGTIYTNNSFANLCLVRLNGQPMFSCFTRHKGTVLVELSGKANEVLTSNRDGLRGRFQSQLSDFLTALAVDKRSALREQRAEYKRYAGEVQRNEAKQPKATDDGLAAIGVDLDRIAALVRGDEVPGETMKQAGGNDAPETATGGGIKLVVESKEDLSISVGPQFILKNSTGMKTPVFYRPGEQFTRYSRDLVRAWTGLMLKLHQACNRSGEFSVGFTLDEENEAECERGVYGLVYYVNPVKVVQDSGKRRMEQRFTGAWQDRFTLISLAAHEFVHGAYGLGEHDEDYAGTLTEVMATAMSCVGELTDLCRPAAKPVGSPKPASFRDRRIDCMGHALTSVIKWMGRDGWSYECARDSLAELGIAVNEGTCRSCLHDGRQTEQHGTKIAELTAEQVEQLDQLARRYA